MDIRNKWLTKKGYSTNEYTNPNSYYEGIKKFEEHINGEYAPWYNKCFEDYVGIDYDEFLTQISEIDTAIAECEATIYSNRQQIKLIPYEYKKIDDKFLQYSNNNNIEIIRKRFEENYRATHPYIHMLTEEEEKLYYYLWEHEGDFYGEADKYINAIQDTIN